MWPEVDKARSENRHELVLAGKEVSERLNNGGLDLSIFNISSLNYLDIHDTSLAFVPDDIAMLSQLQTLVLHSNKLEVVNENISKLEKLKLLDLSRNQLRQVPTLIDNLKNIVTFNFNYNSLEDFPKLCNTQKLTVLNLSKNKLKLFPDVCYDELSCLTELILNDNEIEVIPARINHLLALKTLELFQNKIKTIPGELADCIKLKVLDLKQNPISDRRLLKLIDQCRTKQIIDYIKVHSSRTPIEPIATPEEKTEQQKSQGVSDRTNFKYVMRVHYAKDNTRIIINGTVKNVREFFVACQINKIVFTDEKFKKFIQIQNKLHETVCAKRNSSTIATHDFKKLPPGDMQYTTLPPKDLIIKPLNRATALTGSQLFSKLQTEAENLRKEKKRNTYSGIHKYLYLIEGKTQYPCLLNSNGEVISFPPLTNSDVSKIDLSTETMLIEVTSSVSLHLCKVAMDAILKELVMLMDQELDITQIKTTDNEGNLKVVYPSKSDLNFEGSDILVIRD